MIESDGRRRIMAKRWIEKAEKSLDAARFATNGGYLELAANQLYYTAFYAVSAALAAQGREYGKHTAVRAALHRDFVRPALVALEYGALYDKLPVDREQADYAASTDLTARGASGPWRRLV